MIQFLILFVTAFIPSFVKIGLVVIISTNKLPLFNKRFWFSVLVLAIYILMSYLITDNVIKVIIEYMLYNLCCAFILNFNKKYFMSILISTFVTWVVMLLIDIVMYVFLNILRIDLMTINENVFYKFFLSSLNCIMIACIYNITKIRKMLLKMNRSIQNFSNYYIVFLVIISILMFSISVYFCLFHFNVRLILLMFFIMIVTYLIVSIFAVNETSQKNKIQTEYDILSTNLSEYENLLDRQRISNHENKNQLLVIRGMINKKEDAIEYIDSLVDNQYKDSDDLIVKTNRIPSGGLKGLIYYKTLIMKDKSIDVNLEVNSSISKIDFLQIPVRTNQELCKIVGVFLDNAIQEVENLDNGNINIVIENIDDVLLIKISNNYGYSDIAKIGDKGYTTKGNGHGYGLRLVKNIIESNKLFNHKTEITGKVFSQIITLKLN